MIVGRGDIGSILPENDLLFFASGVSNSQETKETEYQREIDLLLAQNRASHIVYFSSLAIFYSQTRYTQHKLDMEAMIKLNFPLYTIIRIGNISWGTNPNTLINYLKNQIKQEKRIEIQTTYRYVVDKKEFLHWISLIPSFPCEINIPGEMLSVMEIFNRIKEGKL